MDLGISGRRAVVTGASKGIGAAVVRALSAEGVEVIAVARGLPALTELCVEIASAGGRAEPVSADVASDIGLRTLMQAIGDRPVDILINNAGGAGGTIPVEQLQVADWNEALNTNLLSATRVSQALLPGMIERGWGRLVHVASVAAREPGHQLAHYAAAKAAMLAYSKALSAAMSKHGILSTVVMPGLTDTEALRTRVEEMRAEGIDEDDAVRSLMGPRRTAIRRLITTDEVAACIAFLCSQQASAVTGVALPVDGGTLVGSW